MSTIFNPQKTLGANYTARKSYSEAYKTLMNYVSGVSEVTSVFNQYRIWNIVKNNLPYSCSVKQLLVKYIKVGLQKEIPIIMKANNDNKFDFLKEKIITKKRKFKDEDEEREYMRKRMERKVKRSRYEDYIK